MTIRDQLLDDVAGVVAVVKRLARHGGMAVPEAAEAVAIGVLSQLDKVFGGNMADEFVKQLKGTN